MKKNYAKKNFLILLCISVFLVYLGNLASSNINLWKYSHQGEIKHGKIIETTPDGAIIEATYVNGVKQGAATRLSTFTVVPVGKVSVKTEFIYKDGIPQGRATSYYDNGDKEEFIYINGERQGEAIYYSADGKKLQYSFIDGLKQGKGNTYFANGDRIDATYIDGMLQGKAMYHYKNGAREDITYVDGLIQGESIYYESDGKGIFNYVNGVRHGKAFLYSYLDGVKAEFNFVNGKPSGEIIYTYPDGTQERLSVENIK